uniref:Core 1 udp-galactose:n-acetylgalactosamine-alpha-r beta 1,3-galactosyltransferase, putative n=2 Tax=Schistosoma mansoni TaxID=6183 RepID=A0A3Q0KSH5_SCHMA
MQNDEIFKTSYGVGHHWRKGFYFPDSNTMAKLSKRHTWSLEPESAVRFDDQYQTSNRLMYDRKIPKDFLKFPQNPLPPHHWDVHYINDFRSRFLSGGYRRPLSPSHQTTETKESYGGVDGPSELWRPLSMRPFEIEDHHTDGPSKNIIPSTKNASLSGRVLHPKDKETLRYLDPYLTTYMKDHRVWKPEELKETSEKNMPTYLNVTGYPTSNVFGSESKPIPIEGIGKQKQPMIDTLKFNCPTDSTRIQPISHHVAHTFESTYQSEYKQPNSLLRKADKLCPTDTPFTLPDPGTVLVHATPNMYKTEYSVIGEYQKTIL